MNRLSAYVTRLATRQTLALLAVMLGILFLVQCLRIFDVIVVQRQDLFTLIGQALLGMPPLAIVIIDVCMGIGMVRAFGALQITQELHIIHTSRKLGSMFVGLAVFALAGAVIVLIGSNIVQPWASRSLNTWSASIAADIVGRTLTPHRISQVVPDVTIVIGGREGAGNITDFFADDARDPLVRRTYSAKTAKVATDDGGYVLELHDGTLQYLSAAHEFSQISFKTYNVGLDRLTEPTGSPDDLPGQGSLDIIQRANADHNWSDAVSRRLVERFAEGLRAIAMVMFMTGLIAFPNARRGRGRPPLELVPLFVAYADKTIVGAFGLAPYAALTGPTAVLLAGALILLLRLRPFAQVGLRRRPA
jgi:lipopolysaccharide export system permease protein